MSKEYSKIKQESFVNLFKQALVFVNNQLLFIGLGVLLAPIVTVTPQQ